MTAAPTILVVELLGGIGDVVLALPAVHALARRHAPARVTVLTFAPGAALLAHDPHVQEVLTVEAGGPDEVAAAVAGAVAGRDFDVVVSDTMYGGIAEVLRGAGRRATVTNLWRSPPPDERIDLRFLRLLRDEGLIAAADVALAPTVHLTAGERARGRKRLADVAGGPPVVLLVPEAGMAIKRWPLRRWRGLARLLVASLGAAVAVVRGADAGLPDEVAAGLAGVAVLPRAPLREVAALTAAADACVAPDTGLSRIAAAVGTPTVALYGPSWAGRFGLRPPGVSLQSGLRCPVRDPLDMTRQSCWYSGRCIYPHRCSCVDDLGVAQVVGAVAPLLATSRPTPPPVG